MEQARVEGTTERRVGAGLRLTRTVRRWLSAHRPLVGAALAVVLGGLAAAVGCEREPRGGVAADDRAQMARAARVIDSLEARAWADETPHQGPPALDDSGLVALGYVARAQVGVGSPFRLATFALRDPRLPAPLGRTVAWAVLARAAAGTLYATDTAAFRAAAGLGVLPPARHRALIDSVVAAARDARTGEEAVRLGYALAVAEGTVSPSVATVATRVAAQARDRRLAQEDALALLRASGAGREGAPDALALLVRWRAERRFGVERPLLSEAMRGDDAAAVRAGVALRDALRGESDAAERRATPESEAAVGPDPIEVVARETAAATSTAPGARVPDARVPDAAVPNVPGWSDGSRDADAAALLPPRAARRLAELPSVRGGPPEAPVAVAAAAYRRQLERQEAAGHTADGGVGAARRRFAERVRSEETLVAELAVAAHAPGGMPADVAGVALAAEVAMRPFAQDTLLPLPSRLAAGTALGAPLGTPTADALVARFGLRAVTFDASVPNAWRPYHLAQLAAALEDLRAVLPWVDFEGLAVRVGESVKRDSALALHDPATRTVYLPAATGAGTIAHELAHDLDWQTARTRLAVRGTYSTDRAAKGAGALAVSVRGLTAARPRSAAPGQAERPAELFARGVDWFVATTLAASGRSNGAMSAVQDEALPGYAGVVPPEAGDGVADALVGVLSDMTIVPAASRDRFLARYGFGGAPSALTLVRSTASTMPRWGAERVLRTVGLVGAARCTADDAGTATAESWRVVLLRAAAESRARGMLRARGRGWTTPARWSWEARATLGGPWSPAVADSAVARMRDALLRAIVWDDEERHPLDDGAMGVTAIGREALARCR